MNIVTSEIFKGGYELIIFQAIIFDKNSMPLRIHRCRLRKHITAVLYS